MEFLYYNKKKSKTLLKQYFLFLHTPYVMRK